MVILTTFMLLTGTYFFSAFNNYLQLAYPADESFTVTGINVSEHLLIPYFTNVLNAIVMMVPLITMRSFAEEKKLSTYDLLVSYPLKPSEILLGKYLGSICIMMLLLLLSFSLVIIVIIKGEPSILQLFSTFLGYSLFLVFFVAVGITASLVTENQIVAAIITYTVAFGMVIFRFLAFASPAPWDQIFAHFLLMSHLDSFRSGFIFTGDVVTYIVLAAVILLLSWKKLRRHYSR